MITSNFCFYAEESPRSLSETKDKDYQSNNEEPLKQQAVAENDSEDENDVLKRQTTQVQETKIGHVQQPEIKEPEVEDTTLYPGGMLNINYTIFKTKIFKNYTKIRIAEIARNLYLSRYSVFLVMLQTRQFFFQKRHLTPKRLTA